MHTHTDTHTPTHACTHKHTHMGYGDRNSLFKFGMTAYECNVPTCHGNSVWCCIGGLAQHATAAQATIAVVQHVFLTNKNSMCHQASLRELKHQKAAAPEHCHWVPEMEQHHKGMLLLLLHTVAFAAAVGCTSFCTTFDDRQAVTFSPWQTPPWSIHCFAPLPSLPV